MKRALRLFLCLAVISTPLTALAERLEVFRWQALEGKGEQLVGALLQAAKLHEKSGAKVGIFQMDVGVPGGATFDYVLRWDSSSEWATTKAYNSSDEWLAFVNEVTKSPSGELVMSLEGLNWDASVTASSFADDGPFRVFIWRPTPGMMPKIYETFMSAKAIHEGLGAKINIYNEGVGGTGNIHYVMSWKDWQTMAKSNDAIASSEAFLALQMSAVGQVSPVASVQGIPVYYTK